MLKTSEFWMAIATAVVAGVGTVLVQFGAVSQEQWTLIQQAIVAGFGYVIGRLFSKWAKKTF